MATKPARWRPWDLHTGFGLWASPPPGVALLSGLAGDPEGGPEHSPGVSQAAGMLNGSGQFRLRSLKVTHGCFDGDQRTPVSSHDETAGSHTLAHGGPAGVAVGTQLHPVVRHDRPALALGLEIGLVGVVADRMNVKPS